MNFSDLTVIPKQWADLIANTLAGSTRIVNGLTLSASAPGSLVVAVAAGTAWVNGSFVNYAGGTTTPGAAGVLPRYDCVRIANGASVPSIVAGTAGANPTLPALSAGDLFLGYLFIGAGATDYTNSNLAFINDFTLPLTLGDGTAAHPSFPFANSLQTGLYRIANNVLGISIAGSERVRADATGLSVDGGMSYLYPSDVQNFTSTGANTWTKPTTFTPKLVRVILIGGGGGGGGGWGKAAGNDRLGGGGGGGGAIVVRDFTPSSLGPTETVTVGTGGSAGSGGSGAAGGNGTAGGTTSFGSHLSAYGGGAADSPNGRGGGGGGIASVGALGGAGGSPAGGSNGNPGGDSAAFGGGGGGSNASSAPGGNAVYGGGGGAGGAAGSTGGAGGSAMIGGGGGGNGGSTDLGGTSASGGAGGANNSFVAGGGGAGGTGTGGNPGTAGTSRSLTGKCGDGGGGGAPNTGGTAGVGGAGGAPGGGGGGGGGGTTVGGTGGVGGRGEAIVISFA